MLAMKVLVVDDEAQIRRFLNVSLGAQEYQVEEAEDAAGAIRAFTVFNPDAVILDLGLPDKDGLEVVKTVRSISSVPIIVLSARHDEMQKVLALDAGANDYVTKPFGMAELLARLRRVVRDISDGLCTPADTVVRAGALRIDIGSREVEIAGRPVKLTKKEFGVLVALARNSGKVLTHHQLLEECWGPAYTQETHYLRIYIKNLRGKLGDTGSDPKLLVSVPGVGYILQEDAIAD